MKEYIVQHGQSLVDVLLSIYGSIDGLTDLLINNPNLSVNTELKAGDKLAYTEGFVDKVIVKNFEKNGIIPSSGSANVYPKTREEKPCVLAYMPPERMTTSMQVSGTDKMFVDWGDNSDFQNVTLTQSPVLLNHIMDYDMAEERKVKVYGEFSWRVLNLMESGINKLFITRPIRIDEINMSNLDLDNIEFMGMVSGLSELNMTGSKVHNLMPLLELVDLYKLNLSSCRMTTKMLDNYLIGIVKDYRNRRNCNVTIRNTVKPSGEYKRPDVLSLPQTGMEAIWVLTNEREPEELWRFDLGETTY